MIYTVTFNPSLDYIVTVDDFKLGLTNRTTSELTLPGGKGINVSIVLSNLGIENTALYFAAGFVGDEITRLVKESGILADAIPIEEGCSRINLKLKSIDGTEINGMGPVIAADKLAILMDKLDALKEGDTLCLAGSIPSSMPGTILSQLGTQIMPSKQCAVTIVSTQSAISSRLASENFMPGCPMAIPSSTAIVLNTNGTPPASRTHCLRYSATSLRWTCPGTMSV